MPLIINGNIIPVAGLNSNIDLERVVYREICGTCNETGYLPGTEYKRCTTCQTNYPISRNACTTNGCSNFGILGGLVSMPGTSCNTCGGGGYTTNETVWEKLYIYTLTISKGIGVNTITVTRTSTRNPEASTGVLSTGAAIYTGDVLSVSATASSGYTLNSYTTSYTVSGSNITVSITANIIVKVKSWSYQGTSGSYNGTYGAGNSNTSTCKTSGVIIGMLPSATGYSVGYIMRATHARRTSRLGPDGNIEYSYPSCTTFYYKVIET